MIEPPKNKLHLIDIDSKFHFFKVVLSHLIFRYERINYGMLISFTNTSTDSLVHPSLNTIIRRRFNAPIHKHTHSSFLVAFILPTHILKLYGSCSSHKYIVYEHQLGRLNIKSKLATINHSTIFVPSFKTHL